MFDFIFWRDVRRLVVAMSRARLGLYIFARVSLFQNCFELTPAFSQLTARPLHLHIVPTECFPTARQVGTAALDFGVCNGCLCLLTCFEWAVRGQTVFSARLVHLLLGIVPGCPGNGHGWNHHAWKYFKKGVDVAVEGLVVNSTVPLDDWILLILEVFSNLYGSMTNSLELSFVMIHTRCFHKS